MSTVAEIKPAIARLSLEERAEVARCLHEWADDAWEEQMRQDLATGKLDRLLAKVDGDMAPYLCGSGATRRQRESAHSDGSQSEPGAERSVELYQVRFV